MSRTDRARPSFIRRVVAAGAALLVAAGLVGAVAAPAQAAGTGVISGTVTGVGGVPLSNIFVQTYYCVADPQPGSPDGCWTLQFGPDLSATTDANGQYSLTGLDAGSYRLVFHPGVNNAQYAYQYFAGSNTLAGATDILVVDDETSTVDMALALGGTISGSVLGDDGLPGEDIWVYAANTETPDSRQGTPVDVDGTYSLSGLQPGEYFVYATPDYDSPSNLVREYWQDKPDEASADRFLLGSGQTFTADFELSTGGVISGNVTNTSNANLSGIDVAVYRLEPGTTYWSRVATTTTNASGDYAVEGLDAGEYIVRFSDFGGTYAQRYGGNVVDRSAATRYTVGPGDDETGVNVQLSAGGTLSGTLSQTPTGGPTVPSNGGSLEVIKVAGGVSESIESVQTNEAGEYSLSGLAPGSYTVRAFGDNSASWAWTFLGSEYYVEDADVVTVTAGATANAGGLTIVPGTSISGSFTDTTGGWVPNMWTRILFEKSPGNWVAAPEHGASGDPAHYNAGGLPPGNFVVYWQDVSGSATPFVTQYYSDKPTLGTATVIEAPNGGTFTDISAVLTTEPHPAVTASATASPASPNGSNGWYRSGNVVITLTSGGGTVVPDTLQYRVNGGSWTTGSTVTVNTNGTTTIDYRAVEEDLQTSAEDSVVVKRDTAAPTVSSSLSGREVTITAADTGTSGVASTQYRIAPSTTWVDYTAPVNVGNGAATVEYRATDAAGNVSSTGSRSVPAAVGTVDVSTSADPASPNGAGGWYTTPVTVTGSGTSSLGGTVTIESKVGAAAFTPQSSRTVSTDGTTVLSFRGTDEFGNVSSEHTRTIKLDQVAPTVSSSLAGRTLTVTGSDATSGIAVLEYRLGTTGDWLEYSSAVALPNTAVTAQFRATDVAGLVSEVGSREVAAATASVSVSVSPSAPNGADGWYTSPVTISATGSTTGTGPVTVQSKTNTGSYSTLTGPLTVSAQGTTTVTIRASISGGILSPESVTTIALDSVAPSVSSSLSGRTVTINATDATSGVASTQYRLDGGSWTPYSGPVTVTNAATTVQYRATDKAGNVSTIGSRSVPAAALPVPERAEGADRFETAAAVSKESYPEGADVVFVTTGLAFPDALSAGPAAALEGGPLLLVATTSLPDLVKTEIQRLDPDRIVVIGGEPAVSATVFSQLKALVPNTVRISGADRFETSRAVAQAVYGDAGADIAYIATGLNFPDALAAGGAAGKFGAPVILVNGGAASLDTATRNLLTSLGVTKVKVLGGLPSIGAGVYSSLVSQFGSSNVQRFNGDDRFHTALLVNQDAFGSVPTVMLATALNFPDALAGSAWAAKEAVPLYVVRDNCIPSTAPANVLSAINGHSPDSIVLLGGTPALGAGVKNLTPCG